ncbi:lamin tail domain-containing protein, partial [Haloferula sp.]|uniref:lamin tail domain-containing protein n=1 Tax=Haloferula sp. TaxID=2497595 RepID=UPI003C77284A
PAPGKPIRRLLTAALLLAAASPSHAEVSISEFMANNETGISSSLGGFPDWIEIHNETGAALDLAGWYLSDDPANLRKWQFPSTAATSPLSDDGYLLVFADGSPDAVIGNEIHANFRLAAGGEYLALIEPDGETIAYQYSPEYPDQNGDVSYGIDSASGQLAYFANPTPGAANGAAIATSVQFSATSRTFNTPFDLTLSTASTTAAIHYTLDGSLPNATSTLYNSAIPINTTTQVRARSFETGLFNGPVSSASFLHLDNNAAEFTSEIPVIVIETFGQGELPHPDDTDRQAGEIMIFEPNEGVTRLTDDPTITSRTGLRRRGESTLRSTNSKPNLSVETWGEIDEESRSIAPLGLPAESDWVLYAPWTIDTAMIRNPFIYEVSNEAGRYAVRTRYVEVFLNHQGGSITGSDDYYGLYILMERIKQGPDRVDIAKLSSGTTTEPDISGGYIWKKDKSDPDDQNLTAANKLLTGVYPNDMPTVQLNWLTDAINAADALIPNGNYESLIDVESFADHHILNVFANNADGLNFSTYYHKDRNGRIEMGPIWDFDRSMGCDIDERASNPEVWSLATDTRYFFHSNGPLWFRSLAFDDPDFWVVWVDRWQAMREGPLSDIAMAERIEKARAEISNAAIRNYQRWSGVLDATEWNGKVDVMKNHVLTRAGWIDDQLIDPPALNHGGGLVSPGFQLSLSGPETKYYTTDGSDPRASGGNPSGTPYSSPIIITENTLIKTRAGNGEAFVNAPATWPWSALTEAVFIVEPAPLAITEIMYHPRPPQGAAEDDYSTSDFEFIEIQNTSEAPCNLVGVKFLDGITFDFANQSLAAGAYGVLVRNLEAFKARYPNWAALNILGHFEGQLSDGSEKLELGYDAPGVAALAEFEYEDNWYPATDGEGFSLVLGDSQSDPSSWNQRDAWRHSAGVDGSPGIADPDPAYAQGTLVINEVMANPGAPNPGDWIELFNTTGTSIDISDWFLSDSRGSLKKYRIPAGTIVPPNGYVVFTEADHFGSAFTLNPYGDSVYLSAGSGGDLVEPAFRASVSFGPQNPGVTFGRHLRADGSASFPALSSASIGSANAPPRVGPLVIDEFMYHPVTGGHEYVVIRNISDVTVELYDPSNPANTWKLDGINFDFPQGIQLGSNNTLLLVRDTITPEQFRLANQVPPSTEIFSYSGALDNDADTLELKYPAAPDTGTSYVPYLVADQVSYRDDSPWPAQADGGGKALGRLAHAAYGDDPANWQAIPSDYGPTVTSLTVLSGLGSGAYTSGSVVPIQADGATNGRTFVRWIGNVSTVADTRSALTTLTIPTQDLTLTALYADDDELIAADASWKFHDDGEDLGTSWRSRTFNDSTWPEGRAQLGYGDGDEATTINFGGDEDQKFMTSYFRRTFSVNNASEVSALRLELLRDDGAVVYLNGTEVARDNMPAGVINYLTPASTTTGGASEDTFFDHPLDPTDLVDGTNVIAVEVHQRVGTSSDLSFAARLIAIQPTNTSTLDGDADGMDDDWERNYFETTEAASPNLDSDGDGISNLDEFVAGTLPNDSSSFFHIESILRLNSNEGFQLTWTPSPGRLYFVEWTDDLSKPFTRIADDISEGSYIDRDHSEDPTGFYTVGVRFDE